MNIPIPNSPTNDANNVRTNALTNATRLKFSQGDTIFLPDIETGRRLLLTVKKRTMTGYMLLNKESGEQTNWTNEEIYDRYLDGVLEYFSANLSGIDESLQEVLEADFSAWPQVLQFTARCREEYCLEFDRQLASGLKVPDARKMAIDIVFDAYAAEWEKQAAFIEGMYGHWQRRKPRKATSILKDQPTPLIVKPSIYSLRNWTRRWADAGRDVRSLIPQFHRRGDRQDRYPNLIHLQTEPASPKCVYGAMQYICTTIYLKIPRVSKKHAFGKLKKLCEAMGIRCVSEKTFRDYIKRRYDDYTEFRARHGGKAAWYKFHIFERRLAPEVPLAEVEIDHTLIDMVVADERGAKHRPWLTLLIDRCTRAIVGFHIGFDVPSYATVQRALVHAICVKDLSGIEGIENPWPCHGAMDFIITDRGMEFLSKSLVHACRDLGINIINLRGRCPELKGAVERFFGTLNTKVFDIMEGSTKARVVGFYDPYAKARCTLAELTLQIVKWIVDDYHIQIHPYTGETPLSRWDRLVAEHGVRPINNFQRLMTLTGETITKKIGNVGIEFEYNLYKSEELEQLRRRRGGLKKDWVIRVDPYDRTEVHVLDDLNRTFITVPAANPASAKGNKFAGKIYRRMARQITPKGEPITDSIRREAIARCDEEAKTSKSKQAARLHANGALATPVHGNIGKVPSILMPKATNKTATHHPECGPSPKPRTAPKTSIKFDTLLAELIARDAS